MAIYVGDKRYALFVGSTRRKVMAEKPLPYDAEVEYLEGTGTQYIDTGFYPRTTNVNIKVENKFNKSTLAGNNCILGARTNTQGDNGFKLPNFYSHTIECQGLVGVGSQSHQGDLIGEFDIDTDYTFYCDIKKDSQNFYINGVLNKALTASISSCDSGGTLYMFAMHQNGTRWQFKGKIYYCKIWQDDVLVRDYIPVRVGTTGYMYDRCTNTLFGNDGTGSFVLGPDKT